MSNGADFPPRSFPDPPAINYALEYARGTKNVEAEMHLKRLQDRSNAYAAGYGTHVPLLAAVVATAPPGDVLELGAGHFSTPLLSAMCKAMGRSLVTFEEKEEWLDNVRDLEAPHHSLQVAADPYNWMPDVNSLTVERWAVIFVDHGRTNQDRMAYLRALANRADFIVCHDTCNTWFAGLDPVLDTFKYRFDYVHMTPVTTVVSNMYDVTAFK